MSDFFIWAAYVAIPVVLIYFVRRRRDVPFPLVFWLFPPRYSGTWYWVAAAGWYLVAKVLEYADAVIYSGAGHFMAGHARMSVRTFTRHFRSETGLSPRQWLLRQRVAHAQLLLESTDLGVDTVARRSGLGSATALRQHLQATIGVAPSAYRRTFRSPAQSTS